MLDWNPIFAMLLSGWFGTLTAIPELPTVPQLPRQLLLASAENSGVPPICTILPEHDQTVSTPAASEKAVSDASATQTAPPTATAVTPSPGATETTAADTETEAATETTETEPVSHEAEAMLDSQETWFKAYMDYRTITDTSSAQYALQQIAWTDALGLRRVGEDYLVAMGTGWLEEGCGERFAVTLETGESFTVMIGDIKSDRHTDEESLYRWCDGGANVLEFIVDTDIMHPTVTNAGTISAYDAFAGNITEIARIVE